jgi:CubicO group peptidase (beta-lactamase class C family)
VTALAAVLLALTSFASPSRTQSDLVNAAVTQLDALVQQTLSKTGVPGMAVAVVYKDRVVYLKGLGLRRIGTSDAVDPDTVFQLASVSKPIASTVIAELVDRGVLTWEDPIVRDDPGFQMYDPWVTRQVTLRDMFAHRSGLPDHAGDTLEGIGYDRDQILYRLRYLKPDSSIRTKFAYTNYGLTEAGIAAAKAYGESWEDMSADLLYKPLGMTSTSSRYSDYASSPNRAYLHVPVNLHAPVTGGWVAKYDINPDSESPAGGVSSTARDLAQWMRLQLNSGTVDGYQLVSAAALDETHRPQIVSSQPANPAVDKAGFNGLGWALNYDDAGNIRWLHSGAFGSGGATTVVLLPAESLGIVVLTNGFPVGAAEAVGNGFIDLAETGAVTRDWLSLTAEAILQAAAHSHDYSKPPAQPAPALPTSVYAGTYANDYYGPITVTSEPQALVLRLGPALTAYPMRHWDRDVFLYDPTGGETLGPSAVTFTIGQDGRVASVVIENLNADDAGTFLPASGG